MNPWRALARQLDIPATSEEQVFQAACRAVVQLLAGDQVEQATEALMARLGAPFGLFASETTHPAAEGGERLVMKGPWRNLVLPGLNALAYARRTTVPTGQPTWRGGRCVDCAWCHELEDGTSACGKARGRVDPHGHVCGVQEARFGAVECASCGACCHRGHAFVELHPDDPTPRDRAVLREGHTVLPRPDGACVYLTADPWRCAIYDQRPLICRHYEVGGDACLTARRTAGITSPASPPEEPPGRPASPLR